MLVNRFYFIVDNQFQIVYTVNMLNHSSHNIKNFSATRDITFNLFGANGGSHTNINPNTKERAIMSTETSTATTQKKQLFTTYALVMMALFAALLSASAYITVAHITFLNFMILLIAMLFPVSQSLTIIIVWMLLGIIGIPVFIGGNAGIGYLLAPWGGYTLSYPIIAILLPLIRGQKYNRLRFTIVTIIGALLIDVIGMMWLMVANHLTFAAAFTTGFLVFLPLDMVKAVVVAQIAQPLRKVIKVQ